MRTLNYCRRCKINKKSLFECATCSEKLCKSCLMELFPKANIIDEEETNVLTEFCYYRCNQNIKYCNDCGKNFDTLKRCKGCFITLCSNCKITNMKKQSAYEKYNYNLSYKDKYESTHYCSISCYIIHTNFRRENFVNCQNCSSYFINPYKYKFCIPCRKESLVEKDTKKNQERKILQNKVKYLLNTKQIEKENIEKYCQNKIRIYVEKYKNINENNVTFEQWIEDEESGFHSCFNLWDHFISSYI